ncbi:MAG: 2-C-methyl-D-erythritol 4-phosphate cytidylyltransferase [Candidatus Omnitrophica bacterium]|nr:2-C-methyl-D-erythritol 4-phosphate cytidylyltransferase [Candidatus Omnitrophota bacterium]MCM8798765.1 2-C-methyl-D-erythritol 4-phosphate cytidylyltransferase [Candidatus Omnitrophota bacterium]
MKISAIIPSAGRGRRLGKKIDKVFLLLDKKPILYYTLKNFEDVEEIEEIILVVSRRSFHEAKEFFLKKFNFRKRIKIVPGGATRADSVWNGLRNTDEKADLVLIHDGARPFVNSILVRRVIEAGERFGAAILGIPISSTVKQVKGSYALRTISRASLWDIQTPQIFRKDLFINCYKKAREEKFKPTDDSQIMEHYGCKVRIVEGSCLNIKITTPQDLVLAKAILKILR